MANTLYDWCLDNKKEILNDWDYDKNNKNPKDFTPHSGVKVYWKCQYCGHEWQTRINNRTSNHRNCPACSMKGTSFGEQSVYYYIKKVFHDAINRYKNYGIELDIFIPSIRTGIEFDGFFWHNGKESFLREKKKYKICQDNNIKLIRIKDSKAIFDQPTSDRMIAIDNLKDTKQLENLIRVLLKDLDPESNSLTRINPLQVWSTIDKEININEDKFEILQDKYLRQEENSFSKYRPDLLLDWDYDKNKTFNPKAFTSASTVKVWWKCYICKSEWQAKIVDRMANYNKCPVCSNKLLKQGFNDFATVYPTMLDEWDYEKNINKPTEILMKTSTKVWWKCKNCSYSWQATLGERTRKDKPSGCPQCKLTKMSLAKHIKAIEKGSLEQTNPEILLEWNYDKNTILPSEITRGSNKRVWWRCKCCGYEWQSSPNNRIRKNSKCIKCRYIKK